VGRERSLDETLSEASGRLGDLIPATGTSPSRKAVNRERELLLAQLLERLPEDHRDVLVLRHLEGLSHEEIARRMGRSPGAVRMLWVRALARLQVEAGRTSGSRGNP
jgi:RNA polymerase sigma-70 factor (ECF subfamily)